MLCNKVCRSSEGGFKGVRGRRIHCLLIWGVDGLGFEGLSASGRTWSSRVCGLWPFQDLGGAAFRKGSWASDS